MEVLDFCFQQQLEIEESQIHAIGTVQSLH
jgi:hypothetical protein